MRSRQYIGNPLSVDLAIVCMDQIIKTRVSRVIMNWHHYNSIQLPMCCSIGEVFIIVYFEFFVGVFNQSKGIRFDVAYSNINRASSRSFIQIVESLINRLCELQQISKGIGPWLAQSCLILFDRILFTDLLSDTCIFSKSGQTSHKSSPSQIDKWMRSLFCQVIDNKDWIFVHWIVHIPIQCSQVNEISSLSGFSPRSEYRTPGSRIFRDHINLNDPFLGDSRSITYPSYLIMESFGGVFFGDIGISKQQVFIQFDGKCSPQRLKGWGKFQDKLKLFLCNGVIIGPQVIKERSYLLFHHGTVGYTRLVGRSPESDKIVVLIELLIKVMIFFSELMYLNFCKI